MIVHRSFWMLPLLASLAPAQFYSINGSRWSSPTSASLDTMLTHSIRKSLEQAIASQGNPDALQTTPAGDGAAAGFRFHHSGSPLTVQSIADSLGHTPEERSEFARTFGAILDQATALLRQEGDPYDVSKALTLYTASMYGVLHPETALESFDDSASERLLNQIRWQIMHEPAVRVAGDRAKQAIWEGLLIFGGFAIAGHQQTVQSRDSEAASKIRLMAAEGLRSLYNVEPSRIRLDPRAKMPLSIVAR